ncbi:hypothetical protein H5410_016024, partial [Solanum commersonii]
GKKCNRRTTTYFKTFGSLRSVINGVKGRFCGTLSGFRSVAILRREGFLNFVKYLTDTEEEGEPTVQQGTKPSIQEEVEPSAQESVEEDIDSDSICSNQSIDYGSDVHDELRIVKKDVREFKESEVGLDEGYEDIEKGKKKFKVTKYAIKKGVELDKYVNESTIVRVKCKSGCPWLLYASKKGRSENFTIKTYNPRHKCTRTINKILCNSKFL